MYILNEELVFPHPDFANDYGVLAIGGDLSANRLILAYNNGIFPWFENGDEILWWSPPERMVLYPEKVKVSKSMRKFIRDNKYKITVNKDFRSVIENCSSIKREGQNSTWIVDSMVEAYINLHKLGYAHSVEVWENDELVGGLYGVNVGKVFCGESMFSKKNNTSKLAFIFLARELEKQNYKLIDCQMYTDHLASLGAEEIPRDVFLKELYESRELEAWDFKNA